MKYKVHFYQREVKVKSPNTGKFVNSWVTPKPVIIEGKDVRGPTAESLCYEIIGESQVATAVFNADDVSHIVAEEISTSSLKPLKLFNGKNKWESER